MKTGSRSLAYQLIWFVFLALLVIFVAAYFVINHFVTGVMRTNAEISMGYQAKATANLIDRDLSQIMLTGRSLRNAVVLRQTPGRDLEQMILRHLDENPNLASICVAPTKPGGESPRMYLAAQATAVDSVTAVPGSKTEDRVYTLSDNDYRFKDWYQIPLLTRRSYWSDPWFDQSGAPCLICSYSLLVWEQDEIVGIIRLDLRLSGLQSTVRSIKVGQHGYAFLLASNGTIVSHPSDSLAMNFTIFDLAEMRHDDDMRSIYKRLLGSQPEFVPMRNTAFFDRAWLYTMPLPNLNWTLALIIGHEEITADLKRLLGIIIGTFFICFLIIGGLVWGRTKRINRPLNQLANSLAGVGAGRLDITLPQAPRVYELEVLTKAYSRMTDSLKQYLENLRAATQEQERIDAELVFASSVQQKLVPGPDHATLTNSAVRACGKLRPAGAVGGDLFDYFLVGDSHFCFGIADVLGKGIGAAMTMTIAITFLRTVAAQNPDPRQILEKLNSFLFNNNPEANFLTVIMAALDTRSGQLAFTNAGHVPLFVVDPDSRVRAYMDTHATVLGLFETTPIGGETIQLEPGSTVVLVTDGITEALSEQEELFGNQRLQETLAGITGLSPQAAAELILAKVGEFTGNGAQSDDMTVLVIKYDLPL